MHPGDPALPGGEEREDKPLRVVQALGSPPRGC